VGAGWRGKELLVLALGLELWRELYGRNWLIYETISCEMSYSNSV
jgi:hypothetical protein